MRKDHFAYQRASRVAQVGLGLEAAIGLSLLVCFGYFWPDTTLVIASLYVLSGVLVWVGLLIVFHQHTLERLESLESDELVGKSGSAFEASRGEIQVAAKRLELMHRYLMPGLSIVVLAVLCALSVAEWNWLRSVDGPGEVQRDFQRTEQLGWAVAISLFIAAVSFIFARFVAGMAKQEAWQNLRGGAAYVVGIALVMLAVAAGMIFRFFENEQVVEGVSWAIIVFQVVLAVEIGFNFLLNLYRPRVAGEVPRPAFDSKLLSLAAAPDSIVRTINEAINYQFGFNITSSWGYRLVVRSLPWLAGIGAAALIGASMLVVVEPHQRALRLRGGAMVGAVHEPGLMVKWPWPIETAAVFDVTRIRDLDLTPRKAERRVNTWAAQTEESGQRRDEKPFIMRAAARGTIGVERGMTATTEPVAERTTGPGMAGSIALVDAELMLQYRVKPDGLAEYLQFAGDDVERRQRLTNRERSLAALALEEVSRQFFSMSIEDALGSARGRVSTDLARSIQGSFDKHKTGVEVVAVVIPYIKPHKDAASTYEELGVARTQRMKTVEEERARVKKLFVQGFGVPDEKMRSELGVMSEDLWGAAEAYWRDLLESVDEADKLKSRLGAMKADDPAKAALEKELGELTARIQEKIKQGGGQRGNELLVAEANRWGELLSTRGRAGRVKAEIEMYRAAPWLYKERAVMRVLSEQLPGVRKFVLALDPSRMNMSVDYKELTPFLNFSESQKTEGETNP